MGIESDFIWFDGQMVPFEQANVHVLSHTLHYGLGAFEGIRAYEQPDGSAGVWRLKEHIDRLIDTMRILQMEVAWTSEELQQACLDVLQKNGFSAAYLRPLAFLGHGQMGLGARGNKVHVAIAAWKWGAYMGDDGLDKGVRLRTSSFTRNHPNAAMSRAKVVGHYVNSIIARYEANDDGFDEALMLDGHGFVAEGTGENVFVRKGDEILTPPVTNILPGITRQTMMEIMEHEGLTVKETLFGRDAFYVADEAWMVGTAAEVTPIGSLDRRTIGDGSPGELTKKLQTVYHDAVRGKVDWMRHHITTVAL